MPTETMPNSRPTVSTRRELLRKSLALGAAGYVAPMIVGSVARVSAQGLSGASICAQVDTCQTFTCPGGCACVPTTEQQTVCIIPSCVSACTTTADCPSGHVCFTLGCCGPSTFCVPIAPPQTNCNLLAAGWQHPRN